MREAMLIIHFIGLAMGLGTSIGFIFLGMASAKMEKSEGLKFMVNALSLSRMGQIGLVLLVLSGGYLMTPYWKALSGMPLLITKLSLVLVLGALLGIMGANVKKAKKGEAETHLKKIAPLGRIAFLITLTIVTLAVLIFK